MRLFLQHKSVKGEQKIEKKKEKGSYTLKKLKNFFKK